MISVTLQSGTTIHLYDKGETAIYPIASLSPNETPSPHNSGWVQHISDKRSIVLCLSPKDSISGGVAFDARIIDKLFDQEREELLASIRYWQGTRPWPRI
jgi:hypothetical protein